MHELVFLPVCTLLLALETVHYIYNLLNFREKCPHINVHNVLEICSETDKVAIHHA